MAVPVSAGVRHRDDALLHAAIKARRAISGFKVLIAIAGLSLIIVLLVKVLLVKAFLVDANKPQALSFGFASWLFVCNVTVVIAYLLAGVFFMIWFYMVYKSLYESLPNTLHYSPVWTVLGFTLPVASVFMPYVLVVNLRRCLSEYSTCETTNDSGPAAPGYIKLWWLSHLWGFLVVPGIFVATLTSMDDGRAVEAQTMLSLSAYLFVIFTAWFAIRLVRDIRHLYENFNGISRFPQTS